VGTNPVVSHGYGTALPDPVRRLRDYRTGGGRVWVLDPRRTETAALADAHLATRPGSDVAVLAALANALLRDGADASELQNHCDENEVTALRAALEPFTIERAADAADVDPADLERLVHDVRAAPGRVAMQCGTGVTMARDGIVAEWLRWVVLIASGSLDRPGGMVFHRGVIRPFRARSTPRPTPRPAPAGPASRAELPRVVGQIPAVALADEIEAGNIRALFVTGGNPLLAFPQPDRLRSALARLDVLAVVDVTENDLTELATHVLPATGQLERADLTLAEPTALRAGLQSTRAVVAPGADRRPVWWMFAKLDEAMGRDAPTLGLTTDEQYLRGLLRHARLEADAVFTAGPRGLDAGIEYGWVRESFLPDGKWSIAPAPMLHRLAAWHDPVREGTVLAPRREMARSNSITYGTGAPNPVVRMHPTTAPSAPAVTLTTNNGSITAACTVDANVRPDVVSVTHGYPDANPGALTSAENEIDPLTAMPLVAGLPVRVEN
ncbi:MAG TPA: molybdopterin-dependent oxidoreductase, partial [Acidimicrobiia bacterium]|nr:molybdopterin-dependent oxidoreductase [Acidimicrobiia bacterium]